MSARLVLPAWVVPSIDAVEECERVAHRIADYGGPIASARDFGVVAAFTWLVWGEVSPMTKRVDNPPVTDGETWMSGVSWEFARAESWVALSVAAGRPEPTADDWNRLGVDPAPAHETRPEFAYGVWRTLSWLLGVREDFPVYTSWHRAAGLPRERPHRATDYAVRADMSSPAWIAAERAAEDQARTDALRYWQHVRDRLDATTSAHR